MVVFGIYIVLMQYGSELIFGTFCAMLAPVSTRAALRAIPL